VRCFRRCHSYTQHEARDGLYDALATACCGGCWHVAAQHSCACSNPPYSHMHLTPAATGRRGHPPSRGVPQGPRGGRGEAARGGRLGRCHPNCKKGDWNRPALYCRCLMASCAARKRCALAWALTFWCKIQLTIRDGSVRTAASADDTRCSQLLCGKGARGAPQGPVHALHRTLSIELLNAVHCS
jgi:hypothetical protein